MPRRRSIIDGATACDASTALFKLTAMTSSRCSSVTSRIPRRITSEPALLTRISIGPSSADRRDRRAHALRPRGERPPRCAIAVPPASMMRSRRRRRPLVCGGSRSRRGRRDPPGCPPSRRRCPRTRPSRGQCVCQIEIAVHPGTSALSRRVQIQRRASNFRH